MQKTIKDVFSLEGYGVHKAQPSKVVFSPAPPGTGIIFLKRDNSGAIHRIKADYSSVYKTSFCTGISFNKEKTITIDTIEHMLSAICGFGIDNLFVEIDADEAPIFDGSALIYAEAFNKVSLVSQNKPIDYLLISEPVRFTHGNCYAEFLPYDGTAYEVTIEFSLLNIGRQTTKFSMSGDDYYANIAPARTFGFIKDVEELWLRGMALGSSVDNSILLESDGKIINGNGLRFKDEFVRHKLLDAIGDTFLIGKRFKGFFRSFCGGHDLNIKAVKQLLSVN